tara:strand:+ start:7498 stop:8601 length:1104 start_codon:yes stop_codon:yes gene_type:complete
MVASFGRDAFKLPSFPTSLAEVTSEWVTGVLGAPKRSDVTIRIPQARIGYGSEIGFLDIASDDPAVPSSLVVKVPPKDRRTREAVIQFGAFRRELMFYRSIAPHVPIRTPKVYVMELDAETGSGILLVEDCSQMKSFLFGQSPPTLDQLLQTVTTLAKLHAAWWDKTEALPQEVNRHDPETWNAWLADIQSGWQQWQSSPLSAYLDDAAAALCQRLSGDFVNCSNLRPSTNLTLCHMDFHIQNLFYDTASEEDPVVVIDWDSCGVGCGPHDLAYLMSLLPTLHRKDNESEILQRYHEELLANGVTGYDEEAMYTDYRIGSLLATSLQPVLLNLVALDSEALHLIGSLASRQLQMVVDHKAQQLLDTR